MPSLFSSTFLALLLSSFVFGHAHDFSDEELARRAEYQMHSRRSLQGCSNSLRKRDGLAQHSAVRRMNFLQKIRRSQGIRSTPTRRSLASATASSHHSSLTGINNNTDASTFYTDPTCVLGDEAVVGPYYVLDELVRFDVRDNQTGVPLWIDVQLIDVATCEGIEDVYLDFWHANATGVYSGIVASGNGNGDESNMYTNHGRGIQKTNSTGVAQFLTNFPGHYTGRATHIHISANKNGTLNKNGTFNSDATMHVGQIFFDQDLISEVEGVSPYKENTQELTTNADDSILNGEADKIDPFVEYVLVGSDISEGVFAWVTFGVNTSASSVASNAATYTSNGSIANANQQMGGGGGAPPSGGGPGGANSSNTTSSSDTSGASANGSGALGFISTTVLGSFILALAGLAL